MSLDDNKHAITIVAEPVGPKADEIHTDHPEDPAVGKWYWIKDKVGEWVEDEHGVKHQAPDPEEAVTWLGCVVRMGSNYALLEGVKEDKYTTPQIRVHLNNFFEYCKYEPNPDSVIDHEVSGRQKKVNALMGKVVDITRRLAINPDTHALPSGGAETRALATIGGNNQPIDSYKTALVHAKEEELPDLFKQIKRENENLSCWMSAKLIPLQAQAEGLKPAIEAIKHRLFSVELYAGLTEYIEEVKSGEPAELTEKIHLYQRRCYMDEECLSEYETGGMEFKDIHDFDKWLARPSNLDRLLPFPRTIVAFQVRRYTKEREYFSISEYFRMIDDNKTDKFTYLYIRNGQKLFRMHTSIEFGSDLFPDADQHILNTGGPIWAKDRGKSLISNNRYEEMKEEHAKKVAEYKTWDAKTKKTRGKPHPYHKEYSKFDRENLYYDDIAKEMAEEADEHNRLVLVLQGLLDRSPVLHPHPMWSLWDGGGFQQALKLVYDNARAMTTGDRPDFEAYRAKLNESIKVGSITVGQDPMWAMDEAEKEDKRRMERGSRGGYSNDFFRPHGNPGPGKLAYVVKVSKKNETATFEWNKRRGPHVYDDSADKDPKKLVGCRLVTKIKNLFNVSAYKPGDFRKFFADPRTRADYLQWAPFLLAAEEYHAGNREVAKVKLAPPKQRTGEGSADYHRRKRNKTFLKQAVRNLTAITTTNGRRYPKGSLWRVDNLQRGKFTITLLKDDGSGQDAPEREDGRYDRVSGMSYYDLEIVSGIPPRAPWKPKEKVVEPEPEEESPPEPPEETDKPSPEEEGSDDDEEELEDDDDDE
jgi:hypothetical protein